MSEFVAGFVPRHAAVPEALARALAPEPGFAPKTIGAPLSFKPQAAGPKHFSPADRNVNPTEGWDPLDPVVEEPVGIDPLVAAHAAGFAEGQAAALAQAAATQERDRALIAELAQALGAAGRVDREAMAARLRGTVLLLVERLVGEAGVSGDLLAARVTAATDLLADASESALLRLHPEDVALVDGRLPDTVFPAGDPHVARGSFVLESASTVVEDGPEHWLRQLGEAIDRVPVPPSC